MAEKPFIKSSIGIQTAHHCGSREESDRDGQANVHRRLRWGQHDQGIQPHGWRAAAERAECSGKTYTAISFGMPSHE
jgi:hypothetical protein